MMHGYGTGSWWMMLMPLLWLVIIVVVVWAVVRLVRPEDVRAAGPVPYGRETPTEILDRRYALGEIDDDTYTKARARLSGRNA